MHTRRTGLPVTAAAVALLLSMLVLAALPQRAHGAAVAGAGAVLHASVSSAVPADVASSIAVIEGDSDDDEGGASSSYLAQLPASVQATIVRGESLTKQHEGKQQQQAKAGQQYDTPGGGAGGGGGTTTRWGSWDGSSRGGKLPARGGSPIPQLPNDRLGQLAVLDLAGTDGLVATNLSGSASGGGNTSAQVGGRTATVQASASQLELNSFCSSLHASSSGGGGGDTNNLPPNELSGVMGGLGNASASCAGGAVEASGSGSGRAPVGGGSAGGGGLGNAYAFLPDGSKPEAGGDGGAGGGGGPKPPTFGYGFGGGLGKLDLPGYAAAGTADAAGSVMAAGNRANCTSSAVMDIWGVTAGAGEAASSSGSSRTAVQKAAAAAALASSAKADVAAGSSGVAAAYSMTAEASGSAAVLGVLCNITAVSDAAGQQLPRGGVKCSVQVSSSARGAAAQGAVTLTLAMQVRHRASSAAATASLSATVTTGADGLTRVTTRVQCNTTTSVPLSLLGLLGQLPEVELLPDVTAVSDPGSAAGGGARISTAMVGRLAGVPSLLLGHAGGALARKHHDALTSVLTSGRASSSVSTDKWVTIDAAHGRLSLSVATVSVITSVVRP